MSLNNQGRPTAVGEAGIAGIATISGDRGLDHEEKLIFELGHGAVGVDLPDVKISDARLGGLRRKGAIGLPGPQRAGSDPPLCPPVADELRHRRRALSARLLHHEAQSAPEREDGAAARLRRPASAGARIRHPGRAGADFRTDELADHPDRHAGRRHVAQGGRPWRAVRPAGHPRRHRGAGRNHRTRILVPESAHGTNPATAAFAGFTVDEVPAKPDGHVDADALKAKLGPDVAAIMLTNPNTCGLFEAASEGNRRGGA